VAWKQTAAEYQALYYQAFNLAQLRVGQALAQRAADSPPLAVIVDLDDTVLDTRSYWAELLSANQDFFDDDRWDAWIPRNQVIPTAGSLDFLKYCAKNGVTVFYVSSRNQGSQTFEFALDQLVKNGFPNADKEHLTVLTDSSNKSLRQSAIAQDYQVVVLIGDNLNDFSRVYYTDDVDSRSAQMHQDKAQFGSRYILLPNPTDGHWVRALFGDSEPPPSDANRQRWHKAATKQH
jgi:5'-nucleotidase (lipoprotein e(P4) family)